MDTYIASIKIDQQVARKMSANVQRFSAIISYENIQDIIDFKQICTFVVRLYQKTFFITKT